MQVPVLNSFIGRGGAVGGSEAVRHLREKASADCGQGKNPQALEVFRLMEASVISSRVCTHSVHIAEFLSKAAVAPVSSTSLSWKIPPTPKLPTTTGCLRKTGRESWWTRLPWSTSAAPPSTSTPSLSGPRSGSSTIPCRNRAAHAAHLSPSRLTE